MRKSSVSGRYKTDDEPQIAFTHASAPRGGGCDILCEHSDGFVLSRNGLVLLGIRHGPVDVSDSATSKLDAPLTKPSCTSTKQIRYNPAGAWPLTFPCSNYRESPLRAYTGELTTSLQLVLPSPLAFSGTYFNLVDSGLFKPFS